MKKQYYIYLSFRHKKLFNAYCYDNLEMVINRIADAQEDDEQNGEEKIFTYKYLIIEITKS